MDKLSTKQYKAIELMLGGNQTNIQIAEQLHISDETLCNWGKIPAFQEELQRRINEHFLIVSCEAVRTIRELLNGAKSEQVRLKAAQDILNRGGFLPADETKLDIGDIHIQVDYGE